MNTSVELPLPLASVAVAPLDNVRVASVDTTASSQVTEIDIVSPTPYAASIADTLEKSGASPSTVTSPRSPVAVAAEPPAASAIDPEYELTERSLDAESPSAIVVVNTNADDPVPLEYVAISLLDSVNVGIPDTITVSSHVQVIVRVSPTP